MNASLQPRYTVVGDCLNPRLVRRIKYSLMKMNAVFLSDCCYLPGYGMFTYIEESHSVWLNSSSLESEKEFELVGILLGLAIYNGIILDLHFRPVIYKKLQNEKLDLQDLLGVQPSLANSLMQLLEFDGDVEDTFCYTFQVMWK